MENTGFLSKKSLLRSTVFFSISGLTPSYFLLLATSLDTSSRWLKTIWLELLSLSMPFDNLPNHFILTTFTTLSCLSCTPKSMVEVTDHIRNGTMSLNVSSHYQLSKKTETFNRPIRSRRCSRKWNTLSEVPFYMKLWEITKGHITSKLGFKSLPNSLGLYLDTVLWSAKRS